MLIGVHTGDCLGAPYEFKTRKTVCKTTSRNPDRWEITGGGLFDWRPGQPTDDTALTIAVTMGHLDGTGPPATVAWLRMLDWYSGALLGERPRDIGNATLRALTRDPDREAMGNGALMRCAPTALMAEHKARLYTAAEIAALTHPAPMNVAACVAYVDIAAMILRGTPPVDAVCDAAYLLDLATEQTGREPGHGANLARVAEHPNDRKLVDRLLVGQASGFVFDSLILAVAAVCSGKPFDQALVDVVRYGRDTDTNGAIAGGLLGALHGLEAIPVRWRRELEWGDWLINAAEDLIR